jgi:electron-transferring-flavoprotein dehydrogenase
MELHGKYTFFAEGCRGHLGKQLDGKFNLNRDADPQTYGIGLKELWEIQPEKHQLGLVIHSGGWPMEPDTYGGGFLYHLENNQIAIGFVVGLGYTNPHLSPYEEFQRFKTHPEIRKFLEGGKRIAYGARALTAGGLQSLPKLTFPGGVLIGDDAGFLNAAHQGLAFAIKTGALAAEACFEALVAERSDELTAYPELFKNSWLHDELYKARNFKPWMAKGLKFGSMMFGIDQIVRRQGAVDPAPQDAGPRQAETGQRMPKDRLPETGWRDHLRSPVVRLPVQHQPRGRPALPSATEGCRRADQRQSGQVRCARAALPGRRL